MMLLLGLSILIKHNLNSKPYRISELCKYILLPKGIGVFL
jgi:hypothetical protein